MNKRQQKKLIKNYNTKFTNKIFNEIEKHFKITNKHESNGSFKNYYKKFGGMNKEYYSSFKIKEIPDWLFGLWYYPKTNQYWLFGDPIYIIDKFKPSRTYLGEDESNTNIEGFVDKLKKIQSEPILYFVDACYGDVFNEFKKEDLGDGHTYYKGHQVKREFNEETGYYDKISKDGSITQESYVEEMWINHLKEEMEIFNNEVYDKNLVFDYLRNIPKKDKRIKTVYVIDNNYKSRCKCSPRYDVEFEIIDNLSDDEVQDIFDSLDSREINYNSGKKTSEYQVKLCGSGLLYENVDFCKGEENKIFKKALYIFR